MKPVVDNRKTVYQTDALTVARALGLDLTGNPDVAINSDNGGKRVTLILQRDYVHQEDT